MKKLTTLFSLLCLTLALTVPASALEYNIDGPGDPEYGKSTSIEPVVTADRGEMPNVDVSKNAALVPPTFGSPTAYTLNTGTPLTPNLAPGFAGFPSKPSEAGSMGKGGARERTQFSPQAETEWSGLCDDAGEGAVINGSAGITVAPPDFGNITFGGTSIGGNTSTPGTSTPSTGFTEVTSGLYYSGGYLATLKIPSLNVNVKVYEGTTSTILAKGAGHFEDTSIWDGNCAIAGHNRGTNCYFGNIHTLNVGDIITLTTKLGIRTYSVTSVNKISETDNSLLAPTAENCITLFTCVRNQSAYRWAVRAVEI